MELELLDLDFSVCKLADVSDVDLSKQFFFASRTDSEISLVCPTADAPASAISVNDGWKCFRICGTLDFSLIGILSELSTILAEARIGIFAVSTYDTDYILIKKENLESAIEALSSKGYSIKYGPDHYRS